MKRLRQVVGVFILLFVLVVLFFWVRGYLFGGSNTGQGGGAKGSFHQTGAPIIH